ncbi:MAG: metallophosphoesterase [Eubacteriales bacterium]|nr:metallophosphoesterase [Eubacteriales bacterium]
MAVYAIGDLHLALSVDKPMDVFGGRWQDYMKRIEQNWRNKVLAEDYVLIPGDISWATYLNHAHNDFEFINDLPGKKIISKGNHDYWWTTMNKLEAFVSENGYDTISFLHNNSYDLGNMTVCGTRGWKCPGDDEFDQEDEKLYGREIQRLELSLKSASRSDNPLTVMLHYPPFSSGSLSSGFTEVMKAYKTDKCVYGHLHGEYLKNAYSGFIDGIEYIFVSADHLRFDPVKIL